MHKTTMAKRLAISLASIAIAGCAVPTLFASRGDNHYWIKKTSTACVIGTEASVTADAWMEAERFCAARRETPEKISSEFEIGIPYIRCAAVDLEFRCTSINKANGQ